MADSFRASWANGIFLIWKCWCVVLISQKPNGMAIFLHCAIPIWSWHFCFIKQYSKTFFWARLYTIRGKAAKKVWELASHINEAPAWSRPDFCTIRIDDFNYNVWDSFKYINFHYLYGTNLLCGLNHLFLA